ncbi:hypothetical protein [Candidatus Lokiarchaeum ossiferum]|uniref:hypothetical protein n=1 Tax=Candidatus Lokiarchaeum ossiferum TaxID=2951803 RepID=UPI00352F3657
MRIQGYWKILKNKKEFLSIILVLTLSLTLLSTISIINNTYRMRLFTQIMDESATDCRISIKSGYDPTKSFDRYLQTYNGFLSVEERYKSHVFSVANAIASLNYHNTSNNISKQWEFPDSYTDMIFVGIDEASFNILTEKSENPITNINLTYQQIQNGFLLANFLSKYEYLFPQLEIEVSTDATSYNHFNMPVKVDLFNDLAKNSIDFLANKHTISNSSLHLLSSFQIFNEQFFNSLVGIEDWKLNAPIFLCGENLMSQFVPMKDEGIEQIRNIIFLNIKFDRIPILKSSPLKMTSEMQKFREPTFEYESRFKNLIIENNIYYSKNINLEVDSQRFQFYTFLLFVPVLILCGKYITTTFTYMFEKRRYEFSLYLINGMKYSLLKRIFLFIGFFLGAISGIFGSILGFFLAILVGNNLFQQSIAFSQFILLEMGSTILQNGLINMILGSLFALISMINLIKRLNNENLQKNLLINQNIDKNRKKRKKWKKWKKLSIFIFISSLVFAWFYDISFGTTDFQVLVNDYNSMFQIFSILGPIMVLFPFVFPLVIISLISDKLRTWILKFNSIQIEKKSKDRLATHQTGSNTKIKRDKKQISTFKRLLVWNTVQKLSINQKKIEIYTLAITILVISINLGNSYQYSESVHASLYYANGDMMDLKFFDEVKIQDINDLSEQLQQNAEKLNFDHLNTICHTQQNGDWFSQGNLEWEIKLNNVKASDMEIYRFSWTNYTKLNQDTNMLDYWMIGGSIDELMTEMEKPNSILIPRYLMDVGVKINDTLNFTFKSINGTKITREGIVKGAYNKFPASYIERDYPKEFDLEIFMSLDLLQDACIKLTEYIYYPISDEIPIQRSQIKQYFADNIDTDYSIRFLDLYQYIDEFDALAFDIFQLEGYLLIILAFVGFLIYSKSSNRQIQRGIAVLRSKGLLEEDFLRSALLESGIITLMGTVSTLLSFIGTKGLILYLNSFRMRAADQFIIFYHPHWLSYFLCIFIGAILLFSITFTFDFWQIRETREEHQLENIMRAPE